MTEHSLVDRIEEELARARRSRVAELGAEPLAWLAFPPVWTDQVARTSGFPERPLRMEELLDRAESVGWCTRRRTEIRGRTPALRLHILADLAALDMAWAAQALASIGQVEDEQVRARLLARLADRAGGLLSAIAEEAQAIRDPAARIDVLLAVAEQDPAQAGALRAQLTELVGHLTSPAARAARIVRLHTALPGLDADWWHREFRDAAGRLTDYALRASLLKEATALGFPVGHVTELIPQRVEVLPWVVQGDLAVTLARAGAHTAASELAEDIRDEHVRAHVLTELLLQRLLPVATRKATLPPGREALEALSQAADLARQLDQLVERIVDRDGDPLTTVNVLEHLARAGQRRRVEQLAEHLALAAGHIKASPAYIGALWRAAEAVAPVLGNRTAWALTRHAAALATRIADPASRTACLAATVELGRRLGMPADPVDEAALVTTVRSIHDDEDRARALARAARLANPSTGSALAREALKLATQLDDGAAVVSFWVPEDARAEILEELRGQQGFAWVQQVTARIGGQVQAAREQSQPMPEALARWAELATAARGDDGPRRAAAALDERVAWLLREGDTGQALAWLDTAKSLAPLLLGEFETSLVANTRRVELIHRRELDRRRLAEFLPRPAQIRVFEDLLNQGDDGPWALHYLGVGGVGKTTLIRHLTAEVAPARNAVTSRIDFDHINPDFPRRRPAQLLLELATELESYAQDNRQITLFRQAYEQLQEINAAALPGAPPITVPDPTFAAAVRTFGGFLQVLGRPVVLILDTCEELEKLTPVGGRMEQLEATFALIEALHEVVPTLRVVMAGRRPLARGGHGWRLADRDTEPQSLLPDRKPYLLVYEVRGFDGKEASNFLGRIKGLKFDLDLLATILAHSSEPGAAAVLEWTSAEAAERQADVVRFNPFDLDHYANWLRAEPSLTAEQVAATDRDAYVESRILGRLNHPDVERLLPAVAALGRFDRAMLRPAFDGHEASFADAWRELAATEWIDLQHDAALDTTFLEVDRNLRPRLEAYYRRPEHRGLHQEAARRLGPGLARLVDERPLDRLGVDHVAAAIRLLPPEEAARLVDRLAWKVIEAAAWGWAGRVVERLLADAPELGRPENPAAAGLRAMLASALVHLDPERDLSELWASVDEAAPGHPDEDMRRWLSLRASLGQRPERFEPFFAALAEETDARRRQVLVGGLLAAVYRRLDEAEAAGNRTRVLEDPADLERTVLGEATPVRALTRMLVARTLLLDAQFDAAEEAFSDAVALVADPGPTLVPWLVADWEPPEDLPRRIWLEVLRAPIREVGRPPLGPPPIPEGRLGGIDADRFASAALRRRLGRGVVPAAELAAYERLDELSEIHRPLCEAHRAIPPFFVSIAYGWIVLGDAQRARSFLILSEDRAIAARDPATVRFIRAGKLEIVRRFRLGALDYPVLSTMADSDDPPEQAAARIVAMLVGVESPARQISKRYADGPPFSDWVSDHPLQWEHGVRQEIRRDVAEPWASWTAVRSVLEPAMRVLGTRRVAELVLDEGELLALEDPGLRTPLELAAVLFEEAQDAFGAFAATVTTALARARAGSLADEDAAERLQHAYTALQQRVHTTLQRWEAAASLPAWETLVELLGRPSRRAMAFDRSLWSGWLHRLLVAMAWAVRPDRLSRVIEAVDTTPNRSAELDLPRSERPARLRGSPPTPPAQPQDPIARQAPASRGAGRPAGIPHPTPLPAPAPGPPEEPPAKQRPRRSRLGFTALAIGLVAVTALLLVLLVPPAREGIADLGLRGVQRAFTEILPALLVGVLFWLALGWRGVQAWEYRWRLSRHVDLGPALVHTGAGGTHLRWTIDERLAAFVGDGASYRGSPLTFAPYERQREVLPEGIRRALLAAQPVRGVEINLAQAGEGPPWEAPILLAAGDVGLPCWRVSTMPPSWVLRTRQWWRIRRVRCFAIAPERWVGLLQKLHGRTRGELRWLNFSPDTRTAPSADPLVVLGTPLETSAGTRLSIDADREPWNPLLDLAGPVPWYGFIVVMGEPSETLTRVDAEREQATRLRDVAAGLLDAEAHAVLCLPAMPQDLAGDVLKLLGRHLRRIRAFGLWELVRVSTRIRKRIAAAGTTDEERAGAKELALEVTVWIRTD